MSMGASKIAAVPRAMAVICDDDVSRKRLKTRRERFQTLINNVYRANVDRHPKSKGVCLCVCVCMCVCVYGF